MRVSRIKYKIETWRKDREKKEDSYTPTCTLHECLYEDTHTHMHAGIWKTKDIYLSILPISVIKRTNSNDIDNNLNKCLFVCLRMCVCFPLFYMWNAKIALIHERSSNEIKNEAAKWQIRSKWRKVGKNGAVKGLARKKFQQYSERNDVYCCSIQKEDTHSHPHTHTCTALFPYLEWWTASNVQMG